MYYNAIGEVQVYVALAIDHLNTHCANCARRSLEQRLVSLRNVHSRPLWQFRFCRVVDQTTEFPLNGTVLLKPDGLFLPA